MGTTFYCFLFGTKVSSCMACPMLSISLRFSRRISRYLPKFSRFTVLSFLNAWMIFDKDHFSSGLRVYFSDRALLYDYRAGDSC